MNFIENMDAREFIFGSLFLLSNKIQLSGDQVLEEITLKQWFLLIMMTKIEKEYPSVTEIATFIGSSRQNARKMIGTLEAKGYVSTRINQNDRRNLEVSLTKQAYQFFSQFDATGTAFLDELFAGIPTEHLYATSQTFQALLNNLEK